MIFLDDSRVGYASFRLQNRRLRHRVSWFMVRTVMVVTLSCVTMSRDNVCTNHARFITVQWSNITRFYIFQATRG